MEHAWNALWSAAVLYAPRLGAGLGIVAVAWIGAAILTGLIGRVGTRARLEAELMVLAQRAVKAAVVVVGAVMGLGTLGIDVSALVAGLGLTGFALGFALKDVLANLLAGILILFYHPFRHYDRVSVAGFEGRVVDIDLRYTTLDAEDRKILIPNATLFTNAISVMRSGAPAETL